MPAQDQPDAEISKRERRSCRFILIVSASISDDLVEGLCRASYRYPDQYEQWHAVIQRRPFCDMAHDELRQFFGVPEQGVAA